MDRRASRRLLSACFALNTTMSPMRLVIVLAVLATAAPGPAAAEDNVKFTFRVLLSPRAAKKMASTGQQLGVAAVFYGMPNKASARMADKMGQIELGVEDTSLPGEGGVGVITGRTFKRSDVRFIEGKPQVNVNVFSTRGGRPNNILSCDIIDGDIPNGTREMSRLNCKLIGE